MVRRSGLRTLPDPVRGRSSTGASAPAPCTSPAASGELAQLVGSSVAPGRGTTYAAPTSPHALVRHPDRPRSLGDGRVLEQGGLDLGRVDVLSAGDEHVLHPVDDVEVALVVDDRDVAGAQPAVGERRRGRLRRAPSSPASRSGPGRAPRRARPAADVGQVRRRPPARRRRSRARRPSPALRDRLLSAAGTSRPARSRSARSPGRTSARAPGRCGSAPPGSARRRDIRLRTEDRSASSQRGDWASPANIAVTPNIQVTPVRGDQVEAVRRRPSAA